MKHTVDTNWKGEMKFEALVSGHTVVMDALPESGGNDEGARPKELMLAALAGCTGMDVVAILRKMRVEPESMNVRVEADMTEEHPKHYTGMHIIYEFRGEDLDREKLQKAVDLSMERYCGVSAAYRKAMTITHEIRTL
jgi:putative redox protein